MSLPDVFLDDSVENLNIFPSQEMVDTPRSNPNSRPSSLLFSHADVQAPSSSDITPTTSNLNLQLGASQAKPSAAPLAVASSSTSEEDSDWDNITTPLSPNTVLSSSVERLPQSCPESPLNRRPDLPGQKEKTSLTKKLLKPLFGRNINTEDVLTLGVNQLFRSTTRDSDDGMSSGAATPAGYSTPSRSRSKERSGSMSDGECGFGVPLCRSTSDNTAQKRAPKRKTGFLGFTQSNSSSSDAGIWRTQSASGDMRRVKSRESEDVRRPRSGSSNEPYGPRKQLRMLNGRVYGAKRSNLGKTNLFASARSEEPEFVEWGYGGMGSVKTAASVGADNKWSRVTGSSAIGSGTGDSWQKDSRSRAVADPEDDGGGMAWLKKRREQREREKNEAAAAKPATEAIEKENRDEPPHVEPVDAKLQTVEEPMQEEPKTVEPEYVTTAITLPAHHRPTHHHSRSMERVPSSANHNIRMPERRDSEDTARAASPPMSKAYLADAEQIVGELDGEVESVIRTRRESQSSTNSTGSSSVGTEDEDADVEDSPKDSDREEDDDDSGDDDANRRTALGAGVEKISRHKEKSHSQDGTMSS